MPSARSGLAALLLVTAVWGTTFPAMKILAAQLDALQIIWLRFAIALLVLAPLLRRLRAEERRWGLLLGTLLFFAFWLQIEGLARTSSNRNAFVTGLNVLVVPLVAMFLLRRYAGGRLWAACALAFLGMALMFHEDTPWSLGDSLTLFSTLFYALYILALEESARRYRSRPLRVTRMAAVQAAVICGASFVLLLSRHGGQWYGGMETLQVRDWTAVLYLGLFASVLVVTLQAWGQQRVDALRSTIVFSLEPVFAALTAWALLDERMGATAMLGAALVVLALAWSQGKPASSQA